MDTAVSCVFFIYIHCSFSVFVVHGHCCSWLLVYTDTVRSLLFVSYIQCNHCLGGGGCSLDVLLLVVSAELRPC